MSKTATADFSFGTRLGYVFILEAASLSLLSVCAFYVYMVCTVLRIRRRSNRWPVLTHMNVYLPILFSFDATQAIGQIMDLRWLIDAKVVEGSFCTGQAVLLQGADLGIAFTTMAIAIHTFCVLILRWNSRPKFALFVFAIILTIITLVVGISFATHIKKPYYGNTGYWCWILEDYPKQRILLEYGCMWCAVALNLGIYISLAVRGFGNPGPSQALAKQMLYYPLVYLLTVGPISITRWISFFHKEVPYWAIVFASITFSLSGFFNVLVYRWKSPDSVIAHPAPIRVSTISGLHANNRNSGTPQPEDKVPGVEHVGLRSLTQGGWRLPSGDGAPAV